MKKISWTVFIGIVGLLMFSSNAMAEKFYFYKEAGKNLKRGARFDIHEFLNIQQRFPDLKINVLLPEMWSFIQLQDSDYYKREQLHLSFTIVPHSEDVYYFSVDRLAMRDEKSRLYPLNLPGPDVTKLTELAKQNLGPIRVKRLFQNASVEGVIKSKYEVEVTKQDSYMPSFIFEADPFPGRLYLDYKFRIRKEGGPEEVFEGTIPMELSSYNVGWWEKMWT